VVHQWDGAARIEWARFPRIGGAPIISPQAALKLGSCDTPLACGLELNPFREEIHRLGLVTDSFCGDHGATLVPVSDWNLGNQHLRLGAKGLSLHRNDCVNQAFCQLLTLVP
jgi:hypothetical protein